MIKAQDFLNVAVLLAGAEAWDLSRAYCRRAVSLHNAEEEKTMDLELYDEIQATYKSVLGNPLPGIESRVCLVCHLVLYPGNEKEQALQVHYDCDVEPVGQEIPPHWIKIIEGWLEE